MNALPMHTSAVPWSQLGFGPRDFYEGAGQIHRTDTGTVVVTFLYHAGSTEWGPLRADARCKGR